jgi:hypothetical protein
VSLALDLCEHRNFVLLFEHMLLLVECIGFELCGRSVLLRTERWVLVCFLL